MYNIEYTEIVSRIEELSRLEDGWLEGEAKALNKPGLDNFKKMFQMYYDPSLPLPFLFPTELGGIEAEWSFNDHEISIEIDLESNHAFYHEWNIIDDLDYTAEINLAESDGWEKLNKLLLAKQ
jgi:hypothetical protein